MTLQLTPAPGRVHELLSAFRLLTTRAQIRPGFIGSRLAQNTQKNVLTYEVDWDSWKAVEEYVESDAYLRVLQLMEASVSPPILHFEGPDRSCGMEFVEAHRKCNNSV